MNYKGSIVVKRKQVLNMIDNMKAIFRSNISNDTKHTIWGQQISWERLLEEDVSDIDWNAFMQDVWSRSWTSSVKPGETWSMIVGAEQ